MTKPHYSKAEYERDQAYYRREYPLSNAVFGALYVISIPVCVIVAALAIAGMLR